MATDFFEQLAETKVPPAPVDLPEQVHRRLNSSLLTLQMLDLLLRGLGYAMFEFGRALVGVITYSLLGRFGSPPRGGGSDAP